jgi:hypothetical protein
MGSSIHTRTDVDAPTCRNNVMAVIRTNMPPYPSAPPQLTNPPVIHRKIASDRRFLPS